MARLIIKPLADQDLADHIAYIGSDNPEAAERFQAAVQRLFASLMQMPLIGVVYPRYLAGFRG